MLGRELARMKPEAGDSVDSVLIRVHFIFGVQA